MNRKTWAILGLTITAGLLAGVLVQGLRETPAYAQGTRPQGMSLSGRYSDYTMVPMAISQNTEVLCLADSVTERMLVFRFDPSRKEMEVFGKGIELSKDLGN